jgi:hypothetical protein
MPIRPSMRENARFSGKADGLHACQQTRRACPYAGAWLTGRASVPHEHAGGTAQDLLLYIMYIIGT